MWAVTGGREAQGVGKLYDIVQARIDSTGVTEATLAKRMGTSPQTINSWKNRGVRRLPEKWLLVALARETDTKYVEVLDAALHDSRYLPEEAEIHERSTPMKDPTVTFEPIEPVRTRAPRGGRPPTP